MVEENVVSLLSTERYIYTNKFWCKKTSFHYYRLYVTSTRIVLVEENVVSLLSTYVLGNTRMRSEDLS
jgi:hypothetical protein